ncbi:MAG: PDGLE domain-containing protein [archaeon]
MNTMKFSLCFLIGIVVLVSVLLPFASEHPDGLEKAAEELGLAAEYVYLSSPIPDYDAVGSGSYLGALIAELAGVVATLGLGLALGFLLNRRIRSRGSRDAS